MAEPDAQDTSLNHSEKTPAGGPERATDGPRFDERSIRRAQPAVPLDAPGARRLRRPSPLTRMAALAAVVGIVAGAAGASIYMSRRQSRPAAPSQSAPDASRQAGGASSNDATQQAPTPASDEELFKPTQADLPDVSPPDSTAPPNTPAQGSGEVSATDEQAALRDALGAWVGATNARDLQRQMSFYDSRLDAFYLSRNAPARSVRAEKQRVFSRADSVDIQTGPADIRLGPDGRTATMRFRKRYRVAGGGQERRGEVVQELRWRKTDRGWKITSERDVRVLN